MNAREFFYYVKEMRDAQKRYFKSRDQVVLRAARKLETIIDMEIERVNQIMEYERQELQRRQRAGVGQDLEEHTSDSSSPNETDGHVGQ